ncbi:MAG TPA: uridine kinase [Gemmatimonadaceae bacterium]|nr:uridine kinase [Gemmatimonadaceae bacterium]
MRALIIGIAGGSGSGKTTVAQLVAAGLAPSRVACVDMDAYYRHRPDLSLAERRRLNWDHPDALDFDLFGLHLDALTRGEVIDKPIYDYASHLRRPDVEQVGPADVVIVDGILLFTDATVRERLDVKVFVDADADERLIRRLSRDVAERGRPLDEIVDQYLSTVKPMHLQFVEPTKRYADVIIPRGGENTVAIDLLVSMVRQRLEAVTP